jgi:MFS family permease
LHPGRPQTQISAAAKSPHAHPPDVVEHRTVLIIATLAAFLTPFMGSAVNIALPSIAADFDLDAVSLSFVASSYLLGTAMFPIPFGRISDIYGRRLVFTIGVAAIFTGVALLAVLNVRFLASNRAFTFSNPAALCTGSTFASLARGSVRD